VSLKKPEAHPLISLRTSECQSVSLVRHRGRAEEHKVSVREEFTKLFTGIQIDIQNRNFVTCLYLLDGRSGSAEPSALTVTKRNELVCVHHVLKLLLPYEVIVAAVLLSSASSSSCVGD